jgi:hypothetical protein
MQAEPFSYLFTIQAGTLNRPLKSIWVLPIIQYFFIHLYKTDFSDKMFGIFSLSLFKTGAI